MAILLFALWIILNGHWTTEIAVTGAVLTVMIYLLCWKFMDYSPKREWRIFCRLPAVLGYVLWLIGEVFRAAWSVLKLIWTPGQECEPQLVSFTPDLKTGWGKTILANSITLTPGTITVGIRKGKYLVHALDRDFAEGIDNNEMLQRVQKLEGGEQA